jgi:hypothetical protein
MLRSYGIVIPSTYDLQKIVPNPTSKVTPSLYDLANATIGTHLENKKRYKKKKDKKKYKKKGEEEDDDDDDEDELIFGWEKVPLSFNQMLYAALDAHLDVRIGYIYVACMHDRARYTCTRLITREKIDKRKKERKYGSSTRDERARDGLGR